MADIVFITGGQRSGKSSFAKQLAENKSENPVFLATAKVWDDDFEQRIKRHQNDRGKQWTTIEEEIELSKHSLEGKTVLLDCVTLWLTNIFYKNQSNIEKSLVQAKTEWEKFTAQNITLFVVSNELGMGVHPENEIARKFADLQGWMNQFIAERANRVYLMVSGIPLHVK